MMRGFCPRGFCPEGAYVLMELCMEGVLSKGVLSEGFLSGGGFVLPSFLGGDCSQLTSLRSHMQHLVCGCTNKYKLLDINYKL